MADAYRSQRLRAKLFLPEEGAGGRVVWAQMNEEDASAAFAAREGRRYALIAAPCEDWNRDLSPWPAKAAFRGEADFAGAANARLEALAADIPAAERAFGLECGQRAIAGYSLAGLFSVWALGVSDLFQGAASASGSLWFDGWTDWLTQNADAYSGCSVSISLGDAESKARNPRLARVGADTRITCETLRGAGAYVTYADNPGGHFADPAGRMGKAINALIDLWEGQ